MLELEQIRRPSGGVLGGGGRETQQQSGISYLHRTQLAGLKRLSARATASTTNPAAAGTTRRRRVNSFSFAEDAKRVIEHLQRAQVPVAEGLSDRELDRIEATFAFTFPADLKAILQQGLPVGAGFPNWRRTTGKNLEQQQLRTRIELPCAGLLEEVALGRFWWKTWGQRPPAEKNSDAVDIAAAALRASPMLIPIFGHCYIPCSPNLVGNPIFFVYQKVVLYCGYDLADFFDRELFLLVHTCMTPLEVVGGSVLLLQRPSSDGGQSFHSTDDLDSLHRSSVGSSATDSSSEASSSSGASSEGGAGGGETWGRSLDFLAKQSDGLLENLKSRTKRRGTGRLKDESAAASQQQLSLGDAGSFARGCCLQEESEEESLPSQAPRNMSLLMRVPSGLSPRHIEFWSDIANKQKVSMAAVAAQEDGLLFSPCNVDDDVTTRPPPPRLHLNRELHSSDTKEEDQPQLVPNYSSSSSSSKWLTRYLEEMSLVLRQGGWREDDICDMMEAQALPSTTWNQQIDAQAVLLTLAKEVELLSTSLKKAGWSVPDVSESLKWGLCTS
ncbi:unnamed protein product [Sphagnum troendelagicum]|uniref:Uncharacterized protein n=1 Tax=Sphagnum troendelagicum TaxID=128251 RepID=A0ABP0TEW0_9BRYO